MLCCRLIYQKLQLCSCLKKAYTLDISSDHTKQLEIEYGKPIRASEYKKISQEDLAKELHDWIQSRIDISPEDK